MPGNRTPCAARPDDGQGLGGLIARAFWLTMALAHAPALVGAWQSSIDRGLTTNLFGPHLLLTACMVLFLLKFADVRGLRINPCRRNFLAFIIVVGLIHLDGDPLGNDFDLPMEYSRLVDVSSLIGRAPLDRREMSTAESLDQGRAVTCLCESSPTREAWIDSFTPHPWTLVRRTFGVPAPPA